MSRLWYPEQFIDTDLPSGRDSAEAWLEFLITENLFAPGETVSFKWVELRGRLTIRIAKDGEIITRLRCIHTEDAFDPDRLIDSAKVPADANAFWDPYTDTWSDTIEGFAAAYAEDAFFAGCSEGEHDVVVFMAAWSDKILFTISQDGKSLIPATPPETEPHVQG